VPASLQLTAQDQKEKAMDDDDVQDYVRPWKGLTDEELLQAYGWRLASGAPNWLLEQAKQELLGALRKVEASIKEKNT
jgi:predicted DNA-binding transcriptional regulator